MVFHTLTRLASILILSLAFALPACAVSLLRDADMEYALSQVAAPVLKAAGLSATRVKILVVNDSSLNAFIVSNDAIYIHSGLIGRMDRAAMLQAVIAHEAAHITNGHITRRISNLGAARTAAGLGAALAVLAAASGASKAAAGLAIGTQSAAERTFLRHTRAEESSADQSGLRYMRSAGVPVSGMRDVFRLFRGQESLSEVRQDPYVRSHPLSRDRLRAIEGYVAAYGESFRRHQHIKLLVRPRKGQTNSLSTSPRLDPKSSGRQRIRRCGFDARGCRTAPQLQHQKSVKRDQQGHRACTQRSISIRPQRSNPDGNAAILCGNQGNHRGGPPATQ